MIINNDFFSIDLININTNKYNLLETCNYIQNLSSGVNIFLTKGLILLNNINKILKEKLNYFNIKEILLPTIIRNSFFTNRIKEWEKDLLFTNDKKYLLSPTGEEIMALIVKQKIKSYNQLPLHIFQISKKFRNEKNSYSLYRTNEFIMKDSYGFFLNDEQMLYDWELMKEIYLDFFREMHINKFIYLKEYKSDNNMKSSKNLEFLIPHKIGETKFFACEKCKTLNNNIYNCKCNKKISNTTNFIELAHLFQLDDYYSKNINLTTTFNNKKIFLKMNSYGIGITRLIFTMYLFLKDKYGLIWPLKISPEKIRIIPANINHIKNSKKLYYKILKLLDKKNQTDQINLDIRKQYRLGYKIKDSLLNGVNFTIIIGENYNKNKKIELYIRRNYPEKILLNVKDLLLFVYKIKKFF